MNLTKYNSPQVALHWLSAAVIMFLLVTGTLVLANIENSEPGKVDNLRIHMLLGGLAFVLTLARIAWRVKSAQPAHLQTGNVLLDKLGVAAHQVLNLMALLIAVSGVSLAIFSGLFDVVFFGQGTLPKDFFEFVPRYVHGISTKVMIALIVLHIVGGAYHALIVKDSPFQRMWFGKSRT